MLFVCLRQFGIHDSRHSQKKVTALYLIACLLLIRSTRLPPTFFGQKFPEIPHHTSVLARTSIAVASLICAAALARTQSGPTAQPGQAPHTAPQTQEILPSYEGQKVLS